MPMRLHPLILALAILVIGCSSSDDSTDMTGPDNENFQFTTPDLNGTAVVARLSYPVVRDLSRELVTGTYLDLYFDIDAQIGQLLYEASEQHQFCAA